MKAKWICLSVLCFMISCGKLTPQSQSDDFEDQSSLLSGYTLDKDAGGLFEKSSWFTYYIQSHLSLTTLDVYALRSKGQFYKLQIIEFYRENNNEKLGYYTLRIDRGLGLELLEVDAHACGHPRSNPDYGPCQRTEKNRFAYLKLSDLSVRYLSEEDALQDMDWDIAFKADNIKLNSGLSGPGDTRGAILSKDFSYTSGDDQERFDRLFTAIEGNRDLDRFVAANNFQAARFFGADGIERIVYEDFWFKEDSLGNREAISSNWWLIRNQDELSYTKFSVKSIEQKVVDDITTSDITFSIHTQDIGENRFALENEELTLSVSSTGRNIICLDFNNEIKVVKCGSSESWDARFINNRNKWSIETRKGAQGPIPTDIIINISSGV